MAKISIFKLIEQRRKIRIISVLGFVLLCLIFGQMILTKSPKNIQASDWADLDGDGENNDYVINEDGFLSVSTDNTYFTFGLTSIPNNGSRVLKLTGNITVSMYALPNNSLKVKKLIIENNAILTHAALEEADVTDKCSGTLTSNGSRKRVNIDATRVELLSGGNINVDSKGYPGSRVDNELRGYGPGGGNAGYNADRARGQGGTFGGTGGAGYNTRTDECGGINGVYGSLVTDFYHGSAGGGGDDTNDGNGYGGSGGGLVKLNAVDFYLSKSSFISANGSSGTSKDSGAGGSGSGGMVVISAENWVKPFSLISETPVSSGGINNKQGGEYNGQAGEVVFGSALTSASHNIGNIFTKGGDTNYNYTGAGGGGRIRLSAEVIKNECRIARLSDPIDYIPAICGEDSDVIIDGEGGDFTVYADKVRVWQKDEISVNNNPSYVMTVQKGSQCSFESDNSTGLVYSPPASGSIVKPPITITGNDQSECDAKRVFNSLKVINNAVLTHQALAVGEWSGTSVLGNTTGIGRWKKVDIEVAESITLTVNGKINVSGKGYPGGRATNAVVAESGFGPGGGQGHYAKRASGGGGAYFGNGGDGRIGVGVIAEGGNAYSQNFDFGSGGGASESTQTNDYAGMPGGGRIKLVAKNKIIVSSGSEITANGDVGSMTCPSCQDSSISGSGSGGFIQLQAYEYEFSTTVLNLTALAGGGANRGQTDGIADNIALNLIQNPGTITISANGGISPFEGYGSGGGGRVILGKLIPQVPSVAKKLIAIKRDGLVAPNGFNPYALQLNDIIKVTLTLSNMDAGQLVTISDGFLSNQLPGFNKKYCEPIQSNGVYPIEGGDCDAGIPSIDDDKLTWPFTPTTSSQASSCEIEYYCKVK